MGDYRAGCRGARDGRPPWEGDNERWPGDTIGGRPRSASAAAGWAEWMEACAVDMGETPCARVTRCAVPESSPSMGYVSAGDRVRG